ncbi:MAG: vitamin K epoxide reductase family protein [Betaproteobacteria bacterium]
MSKAAARLATTCALVGLAASGAAAYVHYHLIYDPRYASFCDVNETISCTQVYLSRFSTFHGVPVAVFGAIFFAFALLLSVAGSVARSTVRESVPGYLFAGSTLGLAVVLYLGYTSFVVLKLVCVLCLVTYAAVIGLFLVSGAATTYSMTTLPRRVGRDLRVFATSPLAVVIAILFLGGAVSALEFFPRDTTTADGAAAAPAPSHAQRSEFVRWYTSQPRVPLVVPKDGAKVLIVKFNDFQCPPCRQSYLAYKSIIAKYQTEQPGAVKYVFLDYPLSSECNAYVAGGGPHPSACEAAVAVRLARTHNREVAMEEWLFANQPSLTPDLVKQAAHDVGDVNDWDAKYASTLELVKGDIAYGHELGVRSTPTFFVNGVKIEGALPAQYFDQAIAYELQHATGK